MSEQQDTMNTLRHEIEMTHSPDPYISPADLFVAYARMRSTRDALPETKAYYKKRWRFMAGLFTGNYKVSEQKLRDCAYGLLESLVRERIKIESCELLSADSKRMDSGISQTLRDQHQEALASKVKALREHYELMGGELFVKIFPEIEGMRVLWGRLEELGLPAHPPEPRTEMLAFLESRPESQQEPAKAPITRKLRDDITRERLLSLKVTEEVRARKEEVLKHDMELLRQRAVGLGLAPLESVDAFIFDMSAQNFLKLAKGFPTLSRVDFRPPDSPKPETSPGVLGHIISIFRRKETPLPTPLDIPEEEPPSPDPLREQLQRLRKENPSLFKQYSEAHLRRAISRLSPGCREW